MKTKEKKSDAGQEWTEERIENLLEDGGKYGKSALLISIRQSIAKVREELADADLHFDEVSNQLATERAAREKAEKTRDEYLAASHGARRKSEHFRSQLAAALAAIEKALHLGRSGKPLIATVDEIINILKTVDLSLLTQVKREAVQPYVEALKGVFAMFDEGVIVRDISKDVDPDYFVRAAKFTARLQKIHALLTQHEKE